MKFSLIHATLVALVSKAATTPVEVTAQGECGPKWDWCDNLGEIRCECHGGHRVSRFLSFLLLSRGYGTGLKMVKIKLKCAQIWLHSGLTKFWNPIENCPKHGTKLQCIDGTCVGP
ncbi:hypothetical protein PMIN06_003279 [Paraphaeosphaeria minitans]